MFVSTLVLLNASILFNISLVWTSRIPKFAYHGLYQDYLYPGTIQPKPWQDDHLFEENTSVPTSLWFIPRSHEVFAAEIWDKSQHVETSAFKRPNAFNWAKKRSPQMTQQLKGPRGFKFQGITFPK